ncbi:MAG: 1-phosphofructokinase [Clostridiales bacterium]|nr:1-phosphofructokinase [Clostridiales bacterium]
MIYTLTFNPAIDYIMRIDKLKRGETNRSRSEEIQFGGKGINVSTILANLGQETVALGFIAGFTGEALDRAVTERGIRTDFIRLHGGNTRINVKLKGDAETEINAQGPEIGEEDIAELYKRLDAIAKGDTLVLAGSVPGTLPQNIYEKILARLSGRGIRFVVDATGALLTNVLKYHPFLIKPNRSELEEISGRNLHTDEEIAAAARKLRENGAVNVLVSLGADGALLVDAFDRVHRKQAIPGKVVNTVGSGDSMVAGFLVGVEQGYEYALALGNAAGSATAFASGLANKEEIMALCQNAL